MDEKTETVGRIGWQEQLAADPGGAALSGLRRELSVKKVELRRRMDVGLLPEEYSTAEKLLTALDAAESAVVSYWTKFNE
jgi:hypothetical protein